MSERCMRERIPHIRLPEYVKKALKKFEDNGFEAYVVGGAVRDLLRGAEHINDYDITTNALPEETKNVFSGYMIYETGIKHGTVTVNVDGNMLEITTYRYDGEYTDSRHPDKVTFTRNIVEDLARRDFTVNAMALSLDGTLIDPFGGMNDLACSLIRAVGDPEKRFTEDALRIMRAYRFSAKLCCDIEPETLVATQKCAKRLENISRERIGVEWEKLLTSPVCSKTLINMDKYGVLDAIFPRGTVDSSFLPKIERFPEVYRLRCAAFFKNVSLGYLPISAHRICLKSSVLEEIKLILQAFSEIKAQNPFDMRILAYRYGEFACEAALIAVEEDLCCRSLASDIRKVIESLPITSRADVSVNGDDLINAGISDRAMLSPIFSVIITRILTGTLENEGKAILNELPSIVKEIESDRTSDPISWRRASKYCIK